MRRWAAFAVLAALAGCAWTGPEPRADSVGTEPVPAVEDRWTTREMGEAVVLGIRLLEGDGIPRSANDAARWFRRAAEQGHPGAQLFLALTLAGAYPGARGVFPGEEPDFIAAYAWLSLAAGTSFEEFKEYNPSTASRVYYLHFIDLARAGLDGLVLMPQEEVEQALKMSREIAVRIERRQ